MTVFTYEARDVSGRLKTGTAEAEVPARWQQSCAAGDCIPSGFFGALSPLMLPRLLRTADRRCGQG